MGGIKICLTCWSSLQYTILGKNLLFEGNKKMNVYLRTVFVDSKVTYYGIMPHTFLGIFHGNIVEAEGRFMVSFILVL